MNFVDSYYENPQFWGNLLSKSSEKERLQKILALIPEDVYSILDVGCGDGTFVNHLPSHYRVIAIDRSRTAMQYVVTPKLYASIDYLPFERNSFDLVVCSEVLEHLPYHVYTKGLAELQRVARKYIIISTPNFENILSNFVKCPICGCQFHSSRHIRSFTHDQLSKLFQSFKISAVLDCGPIVKRDSVFLTRVRHFVNAHRSSDTALCPQCGFNDFFSGSDNLIWFLCQVLNKFLFHHKVSLWLIARYEKLSH